MPPTAALTTTVGASDRNRSAIARATGFDQRRIFENAKLLNETVAVASGAQAKVSRRAARRAARAPLVSRAPAALMRGRHLLENRFCGGDRIVGFDDRTPDDEIIGAGRDRLRRRRHALLIAMRASGRSNSRRQRQKVVAEEALEVAHLVRAADDAGTSGIARERG